MIIVDSPPRDDLHRDGADQEQVRDQRRRLRVGHHAAGAHQAAGRDQGQGRGGGAGEPRHDPGGARHHPPARQRHPPCLLLVPQVETKCLLGTCNLKVMFDNASTLHTHNWVLKVGSCYYSTAHLDD